MKTSPQTASRSRWTLAGSLALHLGLLGVLLVHLPAPVAPAVQRGQRDGHMLSLTFNPGLGAPIAGLQAKNAPPLPPKGPSLSAPTAKPPTPLAATAAASADSSGGSDTLGAGDLTLALVLKHPFPAPNLAPLSAGTTGDVVVDVVIDKDGLIARSTLVRGLGHGVDDTVLATIQTWTFKPAMRNGTPVASEQELLFHYERS